MDVNNSEIENANFDYFFNKEYFASTPEQRAEIPEELQRKIALHKSDPSRKLKYNEKKFILTMAFGYKNFDIFAKEKDGEELISVETMNALLKANTKIKPDNVGLMKSLEEEGVFVVGGVSLARSFSYATSLQGTDIYNLIKDSSLMKGINKRTDRAPSAGMFMLANLIVTYEKYQKIILKRYGLVPADWLCLLNFYDGEFPAPQFHSKAFLNVYTKGSHHLTKAVYRMNEKGYIESRGPNRKKKYKATFKGIVTVNKILEELIGLVK